MPRDLYEVLEVPRDASPEEIKRSYRKLAMKHHPDRNDGDKHAEERFKELTEAYEVLSHADKREQYDRFGMSGLGRGGPQGFHPFDLSEALNVFMRDFGGFGGFDSIFGGGGRRRQHRRGQDVRISLRVSLDEVAKGSTRKVKLKALEPCDACGGSGAAEQSGVNTCPTCRGGGEVRRASQSLLGQFVSVHTCPECEGEGSVVVDPCAECRGDGRIRKGRVVEIELPAGVSSNNYLTLRGKGAAGPRGAPPGDLIVALEVEDDERFERKGDDLVYDLPVSFSEAALGTDKEVPTPYGQEVVKIASGTQSGTVLTLRGNGLPNLSHGRKGNLYVRVQVWTPDKLDREKEKLFQRLKEIEGDPPKDMGVGRKFWNKMKEALGA